MRTASEPSRAGIRAAPAADTIAALATPPGEGALGMLRLSGPGIRDIASRFLRLRRAPNDEPLTLPVRAATVCDAYFDGKPLDQIVATFFPGPASYTGEDLLEITAHGSPFILSRLLESAQKSGARPAEPGEFTFRAYMNGRLDLAQAEAVGSLIRARTETAHRAALHQLDGGLSRKIEELKARAIAVLATLEASLDHPEEDIPELDWERMKAEMRTIRSDIDALAKSYQSGRMAADGIRAAIVGAPNTGKSSLLNALLRFDRAIVSEAAGTTRDTLEELAVFGGAQVRLIDTAGIRSHTSDPIERSGMERARRAIEAADVVLWVIDRSRALTADERDLERELAGAGRKIIAILNKADLPDGLGAEPLRTGTTVEISALRGSGVDALIERISHEAAAAFCGGDAGVVLTSLRHRDALAQASEALSSACDQGGAAELAAVHLGEALQSLGQITGAATTDDVLHTIFSKFCIGK